MGVFQLMGNFFRGLESFVTICNWAGFQCKNTIFKMGWVLFQCCSLLASTILIVAMHFQFVIQIHVIYCWFVVIARADYTSTDWASVIFLSPFINTRLQNENNKMHDDEEGKKNVVHLTK